MAKVEIVWKTQLLQEIYAPGTATQDIIGDTLKGLDDLSVFARQEIGSDANLMRLLNAEHRVALTREQLTADLEKLNGLQLDLMGQFHESLDSSGYSIEDIQAHIARTVRDHYDVMWTEDFTGGSVVSAEDCHKLVIAESAESDLPALKGLNDIESTKAYVQRSIPLHASFQLLFDPQSKIEIRGADYHPIKAIQQHFMEYDLPVSIRGPVPFVMTPSQKRLTTEVLSSVRNLYILRTIALNADRNKRNVLVLGAYHVNHISYLMAKFGVTCTVLVPEEKKGK